MRVLTFFFFSEKFIKHHIHLSGHESIYSLLEISFSETEANIDVIAKICAAHAIRQALF